MKLFDRTLHLIIACQNCLILWDIFFKHEAISWAKIVFILISSLVLLLIWLFPRKESRAKSSSTLPPEKPKEPADPLKDKTLQLGRDLFAFLREKDALLSDPPLTLPDAQWSAARNAQWSAAQPLYHGYLLRFKPRVVDLFHELAERRIDDKPLEWEELQEWEIDPPDPLALDIQKIAQYLLLLAAKMDIERESARPLVETVSTPQEKEQ